MIKKAVIFTIASIILFIIYIGVMKRNPKELFMLSEDEIIYHKNRVLICNDQTSVRYLYGYYKYVKKNDDEASFWKEDFGKETKKCPNIRMPIFGVTH